MIKTKLEGNSFSEKIEVNRALIARLGDETKKDGWFALNVEVTDDAKQKACAGSRIDFAIPPTAVIELVANAAAAFKVSSAKSMPGDSGEITSRKWLIVFYTANGAIIPPARQAGMDIEATVDWNDRAASAQVVLKLTDASGVESEDNLGVKRTTP